MDAQQPWGEGCAVFSYSQIAKGQKCELQYAFRYYHKIRERSSLAMTEGHAIHYAVELTAGGTDPAMAVDTALNKYPAAREDYVEAGHERVVQRVLNRYRILATEQAVWTDITQFVRPAALEAMRKKGYVRAVLVGYIDLVGIDKVSGALTLIDLKTTSGGARKALQYEEWREEIPDTQLGLYGWMYNEQHASAPATQLERVQVITIPSGLPQIDKDGQLVVRKSTFVDRATYMETARALGLPATRKKFPKTFISYKRAIDAHESISIASDALRVLPRLADIRFGVTLPTASASYCRFCPYIEPCAVRFAGGDLEYAVNEARTDTRE